MIDLFLTHGSYIGIIVILVLTGTGLPIPEEVPVIAAGVLSAHGQMEPWLAFFSCLIGALGGDCTMYWIGRHFGRNVVREHPWWAHFVKPEREAQLERTLKDHDIKVFFVARFLVGIRSPVYLAAGVLRMPFRRFILIDMFCATTVIGVVFGLSFFLYQYFGETIFRWIRATEYTLTGIVLLAIAIVAAVFFYRRRKKKFAAELGAELTAEKADLLEAETDEDNSSSRDLVGDSRGQRAEDRGQRAEDRTWGSG